MRLVRDQARERADTAEARAEDARAETARAREDAAREIAQARGSADAEREREELRQLLDDRAEMLSEARNEQRQRAERAERDLDDARADAAVSLRRGSSTEQDTRPGQDAAGRVFPCAYVGWDPNTGERCRQAIDVVRD